MKKHKSGISMSKWDRLIKHVKEGRKIAPEKNVRFFINQASKMGWDNCASCPMVIFCNHSKVDRLYTDNDMAWWRELSWRVRKKVIFAVAEHLKIEID